MRAPSGTAHFRAHLLAVSGIALFLVGFICVERTNLQASPTTSAAPSPHVALKPRRIVLMVVDALREDFLDRQNDWPFLSSQLTSNLACRVPVEADSPTVTLPRLKALVTGKVSSFVDVILNLGSHELREENLVSAISAAGRHSVFYGDDTWLRMLPNDFLRSKGTHSFFVNDFKEVDDNVTRELPSELAARDWSLLALHFLGLDHIGHVEGPRSRLVGPKLREMDNVVRQIREGAPDALLVLTGDHGMAEAGGHGGSSGPERSVALVLLGAPCLTLGQEKGTTWAQVDLAPTLAVLLGVLTPSQAAGALVPLLLTPLSHSEILDALKNNTDRLIHLAPGQMQESEFLDAKNLHRQWLSGRGSWQAAAEMYTKSAIRARNVLAAHHAPFDLYAMALGVIVTFMGTIWTMLASVTDRSFKCGIWSVLVAAAFLLGVHSVACGLCFGRSLACGSTSAALTLQVLVSLGFATVMLEVFGTVKNYKRWPKVSIADLPLLLVACFHTFSLGSSFCVEEEHLVWFALYPVVLATATFHKPHRWPLMLMLFIFHVPLTRFNSTGDKWASAYDFEDWLTGKPITTSFFLAASLAVIPLLVGNSKLVVAILAALIYLQKAASDLVLAPYLDFLLSERGVVEARLFYLISVAWLCYRLTGRRKARVSALRDWLLLAASLVQRPHDVAALVYLSVASRLVLPCIPNCGLAAVAATTLGWVTYFYQGNSNQLTTVAVAAGYTGLNEYWPLLVGLQIILRTYAGPVLAVLELIVRFDGHRTAVLVWSGQRLVAASFYLLVAAWLREHLFVWSVFAPKLLYEACHSLLFLLLLPVIRAIFM